MTTNIPPSCTVYDWCEYTHTQPGGHHRFTFDLIALLDEPGQSVEVYLYADDDTPPVVRVSFPGDHGISTYIDLSRDHAAGIVSILDLFERPGLFDRRGLRDLAELLSEGAELLGEVTEP